MAGWHFWNQEVKCNCSVKSIFSLLFGMFSLISRVVLSICGLQKRKDFLSNAPFRHISLFCFLLFSLSFFCCFQLDCIFANLLCCDQAWRVAPFSSCSSSLCPKGGSLCTVVPSPSWSRGPRQGKAFFLSTLILVTLLLVGFVVFVLRWLTGIQNCTYNFSFNAIEFSGL